MADARLRPRGGSTQRGPLRLSFPFTAKLAPRATSAFAIFVRRREYTIADEDRGSRILADVDALSRLISEAGQGNERRHDETGFPLAGETERGATLIDLLTQRQFHVAALVTSGLKNREIAQVMGISELVVKNHLREIYNRVGCWNRIELALRFVYEFEQGLYPKGSAADIA